jgi:bis(5'-nucleosidyl)-tetraphosphatase
MPVEKSAGAVIFRKENSQIYYLLLHYELGHWGFPKGIIEKGEELTNTVKRETKEETGIENINFIPGFKEHIKYFFKLKGKTIFKIVTFFLAETKEKKVKISWEHVGFKWLPYKEALEQLTHKNVKEILQKANNFLKKK